MSLIVHRCSVCEHPDIFHNGSNECCYSQCGFGRHAPQYGEPELIPTWSQASGAPVTEVAVPGSKSTSFGMRPLPLCGCDACVALYQELTGSAA